MRLKAAVRQDQGIVMIASLGLVTMMSLLSMAMMGQSVVELRSAQRMEQRLVAFHLAEGAVDQTIVALRTSPNFTGVPSTSTTTGTYLTTVCSLANVAACPDPVNLPAANNRMILATANVGQAQGGYSNEQRRVNAVVSLTPASPFSFALFANQGFQLSGNAGTDSYDSRNGAYNALTAGTHGDVGSNSALAHNIQMSGNAVIRGNVIAGPGANLASYVTMSGNTQITGAITAATAPRVIPPVVIAQQSCSNLTVNANQTITLGAGTHCYNNITVSGNGVLHFSGATNLTAVGNISVSGNGRLNFSAAAEVYTRGNVSISGNGIGTAQNAPTNLKLYVQGPSVSVSGNGHFYGAIMAPQAHMQHSGNGELFGAVVANTVADSGNAKFHYDEALNEGGSTNSTTSLVSWQEL